MSRTAALSKLIDALDAVPRAGHSVADPYRVLEALGFGWIEDLITYPALAFARADRMEKDRWFAAERLENDGIGRALAAARYVVADLRKSRAVRLSAGTCDRLAAAQLRIAIVDLPEAASGSYDRGRYALAHRQARLIGKAIEHEIAARLARNASDNRRLRAALRGAL